MSFLPSPPALVGARKTGAGWARSPASAPRERPAGRRCGSFQRAPLRRDRNAPRRLANRLGAAVARHSRAAELASGDVGGHDYSAERCIAAQPAEVVALLRPQTPRTIVRFHRLNFRSGERKYLETPIAIRFSVRNEVWMLSKKCRLAAPRVRSNLSAGYPSPSGALARECRVPRSRRPREVARRVSDRPVSLHQM